MAGLKTKSEIKPENDCETQKKCAGFIPGLPQLEKILKEPDTRNKPEFRIRSHFFCQKSRK